MFKVRVLPDGAEPYEVEATSRDIVRWEAMDKRNSLKSLEENLRMSDLFGLAFAACKRQQRYAGSYQEFLDSHDIEPLDDDETAQQDTDTAASGDGDEVGAGGPFPAPTAPAP